MKFWLSIAVFCFLGIEFYPQCDPIEYSAFYDSQVTTVPDEIQTGDVECYNITPSSIFTVGAIWSNDPIDLNTSFEYSYYVNLGNIDAEGADGIVFVLSGDPAGQAAIGETGGFLSYGGVGGISPSIALEFDTWNNFPNSPDIINDHAMLHYNGIMDGSAGPTIDLGNIEDGEYHLVVATWDAVGTNLSISFDGTTIIIETIDLVNDVFGGDPEVLIGFTGSTGGNFNTQVVCDIQVIYTEICNGLDDDCDGIIDEDTEVEFTQEIFICDGETFTVGPSTYSQTGEYQDILSSAAGCDSIVTTQLTVGEVLDYTNVVGICQGEVYTEGASVYDAPGLYTDIYQNNLGCDSIIITDLTVYPNHSIDNIVTICEGETHQEGSSVYSSSGIFLDEYLSVNGCDSIVNTDLTVLNVDTLSLAYQLCEGESLTTPLGTYSNTGFFEEVYMAENGCDSIVEIQLQVLPVAGTYQERFICTGGEFSIGSSTYTEAGVYMDTLVAMNGCDSVITTNLGVIDELLISDSILCENQTFELDMNAFPFHQVVGYDGLNQGIYLFTESGLNSVEVDLDGCVLEDDFQLSFLELYSTEEYDIVLCPDEPVLISGRELDIDFNWTNGETAEEVMIFEPGLYIKEYDYRCGNFQDRFNVMARACNCSVFVPNAFSPNGDKVNDTFGVHYECDFTRFELTIYDRYGNEVFYSDDPEVRWNGGERNHYVSPGIYHWTLIYSSIDERIAKDELQRGVVSVLR